jgi:hypothetical protein
VQEGLALSICNINIAARPPPDVLRPADPLPMRCRPCFLGCTFARLSSKSPS